MGCVWLGILVVTWDGFVSAAERVFLARCARQDGRSGLPFGAEGFLEGIRVCVEADLCSYLSSL